MWPPLSPPRLVWVMQLCLSDGYVNSTVGLPVCPHTTAVWLLPFEPDD